MNMDTNKINDLAKILRQNQLTKLDLTEGIPVSFWKQAADRR